MWIGHRGGGSHVCARLAHAVPAAPWDEGNSHLGGVELHEGVTSSFVALGDQIPVIHGVGVGVTQALAAAGAEVKICDGKFNPTAVADCLKAADQLAGRGFSCTVADARFAKPLDEDLILRLAREHEAMVVVEEGAVGGFSAFVLHFLAAAGALDRGLKIRTLTLPDRFQDQDRPDVMIAEAGLDADGVLRAALALMAPQAGTLRA